MPDSKGKAAAAISRRALVWAGSAAVVGGLGPYDPAASERREVTRSDRSDREPADRRLSLAFRRNAAGFHRAAVGSQASFPEGSFHSLAIAIELSLKAYLLHRGVSDGWNRIHIGHDLRKALDCARRAGFRRVPGGLPDLASSLTPYYERHAFGRSASVILAAQPLPEACEAVGGLLRGVTDQIDQETATDDWLRRLFLEGSHA